MDPITIGSLLKFAPAALSSIGALFQGKQDPMEQQREMLLKLIGDIEKQFPQMASALQARNAQETAEQARGISMAGAAGGAPRSAIARRQATSVIGNKRRLDEAMAGLNQRETETKMGMANIIDQLPPEQLGFPWSDIAGMSIYDLFTGGPMSELLGGIGQGQAGQMPGATQFGGVGAAQRRDLPPIIKARGW